MKDNRLIKRSQPHIETLQANVTVMRVGTKQVTQSVFRQLTEESVIDDETCDLKGVPWGTVNYHWGNCVYNGNPLHPHVVWQKGDELRRCCLAMTWPGRGKHEHIRDSCSDRLHTIARMVVLACVISGKYTPVEGGKCRVNWGSGDWYTDVAVSPDGYDSSGITRKLKEAATTEKIIKLHAESFESEMERYHRDREAYECEVNQIPPVFVQSGVIFRAILIRRLR
jgi:hypothetical protein